ncbi:MAG: hypothetical protein K9L64_06755 [Candidatus Izimaplasma sp.]|nr:hypothetical protein [Candidatus Izimaplasma bacterium]
MKNKEIKNLIKKQAIKQMPDVLDKINLEEIVIQPKETVYKNSWKRLFNMRLVLTTIILVFSGIIAFNIFNNPSETQIPLETDYEVLAFETISSAALLEYAETELLSLSENTSVIQLNDNEAEDVNDYLADIKPLIELSELFVNNEESIEYEKLDSDLQGYQYLVRFSGEDLTNDMVEYKVYYNQNENEVNGIIDFGDTQYSFSKSNEEFVIYRSEKDYIEVTINTIDNKRVFEYQLYLNNELQYSTQMELTKLENQYQAKFNYNNNKGLNISLEMRRLNQSQFDVVYEIMDQNKNMQGRFNVDVEESNDQSSYRFSFPDDSQACEKRGRGNNPFCE